MLYSQNQWRVFDPFFNEEHPEPGQLIYLTFRESEDAPFHDIHIVPAHLPFLESLFTILERMKGTILWLPHQDHPQRPEYIRVFTPYVCLRSDRSCPAEDDGYCTLSPATPCLHKRVHNVVPEYYEPAGIQRTDWMKGYPMQEAFSVASDVFHMMVSAEFQATCREKDKEELFKSTLSFIANAQTLKDGLAEKHGDNAISASIRDIQDLQK